MRHDDRIRGVIMSFSLVKLRSAASALGRSLKGSSALQRTIALAAFTAVSLGIAIPGAGVSVVAGVLADPSSVLASRSPGARDDASLHALKGPVVARPHLPLGPEPEAGPGVPVAGLVGDIPEVPFAFADVPVVDGLFPGYGGGAPPFFGGYGPGFPIGGGGGGFLPVSGGFPPVGGGGGGGFLPTPPTGVTPVVPGPVAAVPEPSTWITMILGFGLIGTALRRRRRLDREAQAA